MQKIESEKVLEKKLSEEILGNILSWKIFVEVLTGSNMTTFLPFSLS